FPRQFDGLFRLPPEAVAAARRVPELLGEVRQHRIEHARIHRRCGLMIQVDRLSHLYSFLREMGYWACRCPKLPSPPRRKLLSGMTWSRSTASSFSMTTTTPTTMSSKCCRKFSSSASNRPTATLKRSIAPAALC